MSDTVVLTRATETVVLGQTVEAVVLNQVDETVVLTRDPDEILPPIVLQRAGVIGPEGPVGPSAYEGWLAEGNTGTFDDFVASIGGVTQAELDAEAQARTDAISVETLARQTADDTLTGRLNGLALVASTGAYADLTGKPTLGTIAAKNVGDYLPSGGGTLTGINGLPVNSALGAAILLARDATTNYRLGFGTYAGGAWFQSANVGISYSSLALNPNGGNVGIGITNPARLFHVNGQGQFGDTTTTNGSLFVYGVSETGPSVQVAGGGSTGQLLPYGLVGDRAGYEVSNSRIGGSINFKVSVSASRDTTVATITATGLAITGNISASGNLTVSGTGTASFAGALSAVGGVYINGAAGSFRQTYFQTGGVNRFFVGIDNASENGNNNGSNFEIYRYSDTGTNLGAALTINRASGLASFGGSVTAKNPTGNTDLAVGGGTGQATVTVNGISGSSAYFQILHNGSGAWLTQSGGSSGFNFRNTGGNYTFAVGAANTVVATITPTGLAITGAISVSGPVKPGAFTVATLPAAASSTSGLVFVTDGSRPNRPVYSDGTAWRYVSDDIIVS